MLETCCETCVVHQYVHTTQRCEMLDALRLGAHVEVQCYALCATCLDLGAESLKSLAATTCDDDFGVGTSQLKSRSATDTRCRTRNEYSFHSNVQLKS